MSTPFEQYRPFKILQNSIPVPITVPEDSGLWTEIITIQETGLPNGTYIINGSVFFTPTSNSKSTLFRSVVDGTPNLPVSYEAKDATDRLLEPFRTFYVVTDGTMNFKIECQVEAGQGSQGVTIDVTLADYERKLETTDPLGLNP